MEIIDYQNFDLIITRDGERYKAIVADAPGGDGSVSFDRPEIAGLGAISGAIHRKVHLVESSDPVESRDPIITLPDVGRRLFSTIFPEQLSTLLATSLTSVSKEGRGLRLRLRFQDDAAELAALPWETLYDPIQENFIGLGERSPILRYLSLPRTPPALLVKPPLHVLAILSNPSDQRQLDIERECRAIEKGLKELMDDGKFVLERLAHPTLEGLQQRLLRLDPVHILHFVGHGIYDKESKHGSLALEDAQGKSHLVSGEKLAGFLRDRSDIRLAYLNACEGALASDSSIFTGVAQALVKGGVPAAIAMQAEITDAGAIEMARVFYLALASGRPVDAALTQARVTLNATDSPEWAFPALFSRSEDNRIFDVRDVLPTPDCPYPGMPAFTEAQANLFFGRDKEIAKAVDHLRQYPFLALIGPSGSGKSSLAYAGILPALKRAPRFGPGEWTVHSLRPGDQRAEADNSRAVPLQALANALGCPAQEVGKQRFARKTLIFIDQFEETFSLAAREEAHHFLTVLQEMVKKPNLFILLTVRADFYGELIQSPLWPAIDPNQQVVEPLGDDDLWAAIVQPAARVGVSVEDALAVALIADAGGQAGMLPFVQEALVQLWEKVERRTLKRDAYREMAEGGRNGLQVAIDRRATGIYTHLSEPAQSIARRIFLRLIQFGEGAPDTRRQQRVGELRATSDDPALFDKTLAQLTASRLLTTSGAESGERQVDIAHEALIVGWPQLERWIDQRRSAEQTRRRLEAKAAEWVAAAKQGGLLDEYELQEARTWLAGADAQELGKYSRELADLVAESRKALDKIEQEKIAAAARLRRWAFLASVVGAIAVIAAAAAGWFGIDASQQRDRAEVALVTATVAQGRAEVEAQNAVNARATAEANAIAAEAQKQEAEKAARRAQAGELAVHAQSVLATGVDPSGSLPLILASQAVLTTWAVDHIVTVNADAALRAAIDAAPPFVMALPRHRHTASINSAAYSPDGQQILTASSDQTARIWDITTGEQFIQLSGHTDSVFSAAYSPDSRQIVTVSSERTVLIWDAATGQELRRLGSHTGSIFSAAYSPDGRQIVTTNLDWTDTARIWDVATGQELRQLSGHTDSVFSAAYSPDGRQIVTASDDGTARIWDSATGQEVGQLSGHTSGVNSAAYSPDGKQIVTASDDRTARIWDVATGQEVGQLSGHTSGVNSAAFSPDGRQIVTDSDDGTARIWDAATGQELRQLSGHTGVVNSAAFSPDGKQIVTTSGDRWGEFLFSPRSRETFHPTYTTGIWDAATGQELRRLEGHTGSVNSAAFSPDGKFIVTASYDGTARIWIADIDDLLAEAARLIQRDPPLLTPEERRRYGLD